MISQAGSDRQRGRPLVAALAGSMLVHLLLAALGSWLAFTRPLVRVTPPHETIVASTALRIERRTAPQPAHRSVTPARAAALAAPVRHAPQPQRPAAHPEIARQAPSAPPQPRPQPTGAAQSQSRQLAAQEHAFTDEVARLRAQDRPLSIATHSDRPPATYHRTYFDVSGHRDDRSVQFWLVPLRHWYRGGDICYYTHYTAQYRAGGSEEGNIPWPICYPVEGDRIANPPYVHSLPAPVPPAGYTLPAGTYLSPLLAEIYNQRANPPH